MKRRSKAGGKPVKTRRRKTVTPKGRNAPKVVRSRGPSIAKLREQLDHRTRERDEALALQIANAEVINWRSCRADPSSPRQFMTGAPPSNFAATQHGQRVDPTNCWPRRRFEQGASLSHLVRTSDLPNG